MCWFRFFLRCFFLFFVLWFFCRFLVGNSFGFINLGLPRLFFFRKRQSVAGIFGGLVYLRYQQTREGLAAQVAGALADVGLTSIPGLVISTSRYVSPLCFAEAGSLRATRAHQSAAHP